MHRRIAADGEGDRTADWNSDFVWMVDQAGQHVGPLTTIQLALAAKNGLLKPDAMIWRDGLARWYAAEEIAGLLPATPHRAVRSPSPPAPAATSEIKPLPATSHPNRSRAIERLLADRASHDPIAAASPLPLPAPVLERRTELDRSFRDTSVPAVAAGADISRPGDEFDRLRAMLRQRNAAPVAATRELMPAAATVEIAAAPPVQPSILPAGPKANFGITENLARHVADSIVLVLERHRIKTIDDLATGDRLRQLAGMVVDHLPGTLRLGLMTTIGRPVVETKIVELFELMLFNIPRHQRQRDLRDLVEDYVPPVARAIEEAVTGAAAKVGSFVMANITQAVAALRKELPAALPPPPPPMLVSSPAMLAAPAE